MKYLISGKVTAINNVYLHINLYNLSVGALIFDECNEVLGEILSSNNIETIAVSFTRKVYIDSVIYTYNNPYSYYLSPDKIGSITDIYGKSLYNHSFRCKLNIQDIELTLSQNRNTIVGRKQIRHQLMTGIRSIDLLYPLGVGQRIAVVAPAGIGKSTLIKQIAKNTFSDINVIALVGERGREVSELINSNNLDCLSKSIVIYATSDSPPLERINCLEIALCISEYLRDEGLNVLFLVDSFTRYLRAHKEQALFLQEPPIYKSFPNSTITQIAKILERASNSDKGTISTIITLLQESEDDEDPLINEVISVVDGHLFLCKETQYKNIYPALNFQKSLSRLENQLLSRDMFQISKSIKQLIGEIAQIQRMTTYGIKLNAKQKRVSSKWPTLKCFLDQNDQTFCKCNDSAGYLQELLSDYQYSQ